MACAEYAKLVLVLHLRWTSAHSMHPPALGTSRSQIMATPVCPPYDEGPGRMIILYKAKAESTALPKGQ